MIARIALRGTTVLLAGALTVMAGPLASPNAAPCDSSASLATLVSLGSTGCSVGEFTFFKFSFLSIPTLQPNSQSLVAEAQDITVNIPSDARNTLEFLSDKFNVQAGDRVRYLIGYTLDPPPPILPGFELDLFTETPVSPGIATVSASVCAGGIFFFLDPNVCLDVDAPGYNPEPYSLSVFHLGLPAGAVQLKDSIFFDRPTNLIDVLILIDLDARLGGSSQIRGLGNRQPGTPVPEPATVVLIGGGLAALVWFRRRSPAPASLER